MEPWKDLALRPPPVLTSPIINKIDIKTLQHVCKNMVRVLSMQSPLHYESALLSRFLYKYDKKFRNDIGYRSIRKTLTTLKKYLQLNLLKDIENFMSFLPNEEDDFLPSRQMLQFILIRIITFSKLMLRVCICSKIAAIFYLDRIKRGESHWMSVMPYALLSRIWSMSKVLLQHSTSWYKCLYCFHDKLQLKGLEFLPRDFILPDELGEWLEIKNLDQFGKLEWTNRSKFQIPISLEDEDCDTFDNVLRSINVNNNEEQNCDKDDIITNDLTIPEIDTTPRVDSIDFGQAISRESFNILGDFQKKISNTPKVTHYFGKVTNLKTLTEFIETEESLRNNNDNESLTKHLSFMQWQSLKIALSKQCNDLSNKRKIEKKLQKIWKEKCLDYL